MKSRTEMFESGTNQTERQDRYDNRTGGIMGKKICTVKSKEKTKCYEAGTTYRRIAEDFQEDYPHWYL